MVPNQAFVVIFWVMGPRTPGQQTFLTFNDDNGWGSKGLAASLSATSLSIEADT